MVTDIAGPAIVGNDHRGGIEFTGSDSVLTDTFLVVEEKEYLEYPSAVAVDEKGVIYVCDPSSSSIVRFRLSNQLDENLNPIK